MLGAMVDCDDFKVFFSSFLFQHQSKFIDFFLCVRQEKSFCEVKMNSQFLSAKFQVQVIKSLCSGSTGEGNLLFLHK